MDKNVLEKTKSRAFRKDVFLLGKDDEGIMYWLEAPSWDCDWYWGFGYVETYQRNYLPNHAKDIDSHQHIDSSFMGKQEFYDHEKGCFRQGEYIHNIYDSPRLVSTTFNKDEGWELSELFKQFYLLKEMADFCHREKPGCHVTTSPVDHGNLKDWYEKINQVMIPKITSEIIRILSGEKE
jgi:hypothetical protein